jgi:DNA-binding GntR family transcriptional regulator
MRYPNRGAVVTKLSMTDVLEIWQLREILEPAACALAAGRIDRDALARIEGAFLELRGQEMGPEAYEAFLRADMGLHGLIVDSTGNATLRSVLGMLIPAIRKGGKLTQGAVANQLEVMKAIGAVQGDLNTAEGVLWTNA